MDTQPQFSKKLHASLFSLTELEITIGLKNAVSKEKGATLRVLEYLKEVERRKLYAAKAYSSLFEYAVKELRYSEAQASERINSMRLLSDLPEVKQLLFTGALSVTTAAQIQRFIRNEKRFHEPLSEEQKKVVVSRCANQSKREVEKILFNLQSDEVRNENFERTRTISETHTELKFAVSEEVIKKIKEIKNLVGDESLAKIFSDALTVYIKDKKRHKSCEKLIKKVSCPEKQENLVKELDKVKVSNSRYVPRSIKRMLHARSQGQCEFVDPESKNRCLSRYLIQIDHIIPYAYGGLTEINNLRHLCQSHNLRSAYEWFS